jgi:hypothetical protein
MIVTADTVYYISEAGESTVDTTEFLKKDDAYIRIHQAYKEILELSRNALSRASEYHFALESIYSGAVRFNENEKKYSYMVETIDGIFTNNVD